MATLTLKNITKKWSSAHSNFIGVNRLNLNINEREFIVLLGPSGCGKTTTLRMIAGLEIPTTGEILIDDKLVNHLEPKDRDIAMVFQNYGLYPHLSVYENIRFPLKVRKIEKLLQREKVMKAAYLVELNKLLDRKPKELSGGQRQRVALARAIVREPKIFLMDEPLSNLDAKLRTSTRAQLKNLQHQLATTTIYVTHDQVEAMTLADRVVIMNQGEIQQIGTPFEIYNQPTNTFVASFIGSPPMNILEGQLENKSFQSSEVEIKSLNNIKKKQKVFLAFRAEDTKVVSKTAKASFQATIYNLELLGDSILINFKIQNKIISIKTTKDFKGKIGEKIKIKISFSKCHFFNFKTGKKILNI